MLVNLHIKNFITISEQTISFDSGLHVFTGETGAGKSVILSALEVVLGGRASPKLIRQGKDCCQIQAEFDVSDLDKEKRDSFPEFIEDSELIISRSFNLNGRGKIFINGNLATSKQLSEVTEKLINICGQGHQVELLKERLHVNLLDEFGGIKKKTQEYQSLFFKWKNLVAEYENLQKKSQEATKRSLELEYIIQDLKSAGIGQESKEDLEQNLKKIGSSEHLMKYAGLAEELFVSESGISEQIASFILQITKLSEIDKSQQDLLQRA
ncbi:MAG: AAA family ATPase, partial [Bdellovibrionales bacterium]|nr:AAA family ATPase [Bdellovibrionales bacterium]